MALEFSDRERREIDALIARYPEGKQGAALLPVLHLAQDRFGHLDADVQLLVARTLDVAPARVHEVVTFYEMYHEHPEGQFHLEVCTNISCHLCGGDAILDHLERELGIRPGQITPDGLFSLMEAECLASCGSGPMMKVGLDYYEFLTVEAVDQLIARFRDIAPRLEGKPYKYAPGGPHVGPVPGFEPLLPPVGAAPTPISRMPVGEPPDPAHREKVDAEAGRFEAEAEREAEELKNGAAKPETQQNEQVAKEVAEEARRSERKAKGGDDS